MNNIKIVYCKDCIYNVANWNKSEIHNDELNNTDYTDITCDYSMTDGMEADDFCSHGKRVDEILGEE